MYRQLWCRLPYTLEKIMLFCLPPLLFSSFASWVLKRQVLYYSESSLVFNSWFLLWPLSVPCYWDYFPFLETRLGNSNHTARSIVTIDRAKWFMASFLFLRFCTVWKTPNGFRDGEKWVCSWTNIKLLLNASPSEE